MYGYNDYRNYLAHYGVKGMKWGVRRSKEELKYNKESIKASVNRYLKNNPTKISQVKVDKLTGPGKKLCEDMVLPKIYNVKVSEISDHAAEQAADRKVSAEDIIDTIYNVKEFSNELNVNNKGEKSVGYIGEHAVVNVNPKTYRGSTLWGKRKKV